MPYTDAEYGQAGGPEEEPWHVYAEEDVPDTDPSTRHTARSVCTSRMLGTGHLMAIKEHSRTAFFDSLSPHSLVDWLSHPKVCEECRREIAARLGIEMEAVRAKIERGKREGRL